MALPAFLRKKADFGGDLQDNSSDVARLREGHFAATSNYGNCVLFDGNGMHRGGMVNKGERRCLFILLAENLRRAASDVTSDQLFAPCSLLGRVR